MDENQITRVCLEDPLVQPYYFGTIARDEIPIRWPKVGTYIMNSQIREKPGLHWLALSLGMEFPNRATYIDSFGRPPSGDIASSLVTQGFKVVYNDVVIQHPLSQSCGKIALLFLKLWARGYNSVDIVSKFLYDPVSDPFKSEALAESVIAKTSTLKKGRIIPSLNIK